MKKSIYLAIILIALTLISGCMRDSEIASHNLSKEADQFRVKRRVVFYNSITDTYMFEMIGNLSIYVDTADNQLEVTAKVGDKKYQKHFLGLSDNVTYIVEQLEYSEVDKYRYEIVFKPQSILPVKVGIE